MGRLRSTGWRLANRFGGTSLRAWSQNDQYRQGRWDRLADGRRPEVIHLAEELAAGGAIVELGCGEGHLARRLDPSTYRQYLGLDISSIAIDNARDLGLERCWFEVQDLATWPGTSGADLIIAEESLYYLPAGGRRRLLDRCHRSLTPGGAILVTFSDGATHGPVIEQCQELFDDHTIVLGEHGAVFLVLRGGATTS